MKSQNKDNKNIQKYTKSQKYCSFEKLNNVSTNIKLTYQNSPQIKNINNSKNKIHFNKRAKIKANLNIISNSNININSILNNPKIYKNKSHSKYNLNKKTKNINNLKIGSYFQSSSHNHSYINIKKQGKKIILCVAEPPQKLKDLNELNISNMQNNISQLTDQNNNINSCFETNNSSYINNNKSHNDYYSLNKVNYSPSISLNNTGSNSNGKQNNIVKIDKLDNKNLFNQYQKNNIKGINKNKIHNKKNEIYNKSLNKYNSTYNSLNNSKNKSKSKSNTNILLNDTDLTPYNNKANKKSCLSKPIINDSSYNKNPIMIKNNNSITFKNIEKIDVQITSINNLLNNKFIKEINNIHTEMEKNIKSNQANSRSKNYNIIKLFFKKFLKILNDYLNKNAFNCINLFLQKIINGYHDIFLSISSENKNIQKQNILLNKKIEEIQKMIKKSEKKINLLQQKNIELLNQIKIIKKPYNEDMNYINLDIYKNNLKKNKSVDKIEIKEQNHKILKLNEQNLDDLDALYFFDKVNMNCKRSSSLGIPLIPIEENNIETKRKKTYSKKLNDYNNNYFLEIKKAFK